MNIAALRPALLGALITTAGASAGLALPAWILADGAGQFSISDPVAGLHEANSGAGTTMGALVYNPTGSLGNWSLGGSVQVDASNGGIPNEIGHGWGRDFETISPDTLRVHFSGGQGSSIPAGDGAVEMLSIFTMSITAQSDIMLLICENGSIGVGSSNSGWGGYQSGSNGPPSGIFEDGVLISIGMDNILSMIAGRTYEFRDVLNLLFNENDEGFPNASGGDSYNGSIDLKVIPAPGAASVLMVAGLTAMRRRR